MLQLLDNDVTNGVTVANQGFFTLVLQLLDKGVIFSRQVFYKRDAVASQGC